MCRENPIAVDQRGRQAFDSAFSSSPDHRPISFCSGWEIALGNASDGFGLSSSPGRAKSSLARSAVAPGPHAANMRVGVAMGGALTLSYTTEGHNYFLA